MEICLSTHEVFNVTKEDIKVRMAVEFVMGGKEPMSELVNQIYSDFNERNGTDVAVPKK